MKPSLNWQQQVALLQKRGLVITDADDCEAFLKAANYYRFSGYFRYFQNNPESGNNEFTGGITFDMIRNIYNADIAVRAFIGEQLAYAETLLRTRLAYVIGQQHAPGAYLEESFYASFNNGTHGSVADLCIRDIQRSKERYIAHYCKGDVKHADASTLGDLPIWVAVEAWSFGTLSKCIEYGDNGNLAEAVAAELGVPKRGFAYRVRALVYLRNRCAHHSRIWNHSVLDAGPTPNNVRHQAKKLVGTFKPRSVLDTVASLNDIVMKGTKHPTFLPAFKDEFSNVEGYWSGISDPKPVHDRINLN